MRSFMAAARVDGVRSQSFRSPESKRTLRECGAAEQADSGISAFGWRFWLRDCVHGLEDEPCGAIFALKCGLLGCLVSYMPLALAHQSERAVLRRENEGSGPRMNLARKAPLRFRKR